MTTENATTKIRAAAWERVKGGWRRLDAEIPTQVRACVTPRGERFVWVAFDPTLARPSEEGATFSVHTAMLFTDQALTRYGVAHDGALSRRSQRTPPQMNAYIDNHDPGADAGASAGQPMTPDEVKAHGQR